MREVVYSSPAPLTFSRRAVRRHHLCDGWGGGGGVRLGLLEERRTGEKSLGALEEGLGA